MNKTKIEWCDSTWNPVTGCLHKCEYCYARKIATRFGTIDKAIESAAEEGIDLDSVYFRNPEHFAELKEPFRDENGKIEPYPNNFYPTFHQYRLDEPARKTKPQNIFVCSMADLFGEWIPDEWLKQIFATCAKAPQHNFLFLTKNPKRYYDLVEQDPSSPNGALPIADNMWFGTTITSVTDPIFWGDGWNTFLSIEPLLTDFKELETAFVDMSIKWVIIGAETGNRKDKVIPKKEWIDQICRVADKAELPVYMKDSLIPIVGEENMRREFPEKLKRHSR